MKARQDIAVFLLRIALAVGFLSAVFSRLNLWGVQSSGWSKFVRYTAEVNSFLPHSWMSASLKRDRISSKVSSIL
ncbi:hypothetical protein CMU93_06500 [Elizabethkingia anophelis]|nr:hypothetical protein [Elizabethkingia anophelis]